MNKRTGILIFTVLTLISVMPNNSTRAGDFSKYISKNTVRKIAIITLIGYIFYNVIDACSTPSSNTEKQNLNEQENYRQLEQVQNNNFCNAQYHNDLKENRGIFCNKCKSLL